VINLNELAKTSYEISQKRGKPYSDVSAEKVLKYTAGEVIEASFAASVYKHTSGKSGQLKAQEHRLFAGELADIIVCVLIAAHSENIDIEQSLIDCVEKNKKRIRS